jgi:type IX secretion system PorP/SprF family membrane protein
MKMMMRIVMAGMLLLLMQLGQAQDYKLSQFYNGPLSLNPALTGKTKGLYRFVANYRSQFAPVSNPAAYSTIAASADFGLLREQMAGNILGVGLQIVNLSDGAGSLKTTMAMVSGAYHLGLGYNLDHYLSAGFQAGIVQRRVDLASLFFQSQFTGSGFDQSIDPGENFDRTKILYPSLNAGIFWSSNFTDMISAYAGTSLFRILKPKESFFDAPNERDFRVNAHGGAIIDIKKFIIINPNAIYSKQAANDHIIVGSQFGFNLSGKSDPYATTLFSGFWYDLDKAFIASAGIQFKGMQVGMSYDATLGDIQNATNAFGAFELSLIYEGKPISTRRGAPMMCPRF